MNEIIFGIESNDITVSYRYTTGVCYCNQLKKGLNIELCIDNNVYKIFPIDLLQYSDIIDPSYNSNALIDFNRSGITIIVNHSEGDFFNNNYDPTIPFDYGCQYVAMEYQSVDSYMDIYMKSFKHSAFVLKDSGLR